MQISLNVPKEDINKIFAMFDAFPEIQASVLEDIANTVRTVIQGVSPIGLDYRPKQVSKTGAVKKGTGGWFRRAARKEGTLKTSWSQVQEMGGGYGFYAGVPYARIVEFGLYPGLGPRTVTGPGGIYSSQAPQGMVAPLVTGGEVGGMTLKKIVAQVKARMIKKMKEKASPT